VALEFCDILDELLPSIQRVGGYLHVELNELARKHSFVKEVRGFGLIIGVQFNADAPAFRGSDKTAAIQAVSRLHEKGLLTVPAATSVIRLLPALNLSRSEAEEGLEKIEALLQELHA